MKKLFSFLGRSFLNIATVIGVMVILSGLLSCTVGVYVVGRHTPAPLGDMSVLVVRLTPEFNQPAAMGFLDAPFAPHAPTVRDVADALFAAAADPKIKAVAFSMRGPSLSTADVQEMRAGLAAVRAAGKFTIIYAPSIDGLAPYYLAAAFDNVWVQPVGTVALDGLGGDQPYFKGLFDKLGIGANFIQRREYKSAMESFTSTKMSDPARANATSLLNDIADQVLAAVAQDRTRDSTVMRTALDQGVLTGPEALKAGLIDRLAPADQLDDVILEKLGLGQAEQDKVNYIGVGDYVALQNPEADPSYLSWAMGGDDSSTVPDGYKRVALVTIDGAIYAEHESGGLMGEVGYYTADDWAGAIEDAADDDGVAAIVVRVNSPGGTPSGAEDIRRAIEIAKEKGKVVVVTMGAVAASGGYWLAVPADYILANPATITGSIGVVGGKFDVAGLAQNWGVTFDGASVGKNVNLFSPHRGFTPAERARMEAVMDETYGYFKTIVGQGRALDPNVVEGLARGQVYAGSRAKTLGLVDELGGYHDALAYLAQKVGVKDQTRLIIEDWPAPLTPIEEFIALLQGQVMMGHMGAMAARVLDLRPHAGVLVIDRFL